MLDVKQFICHLLGIASREDKEKEACLMYLFFKPIVDDKAVQAEIDDIFDALEYEINAVFESEPIKKFIIQNNIKLRAVYKYSKEMESLSSNNVHDIK